MPKQTPSLRGGLYHVIARGNQGNAVFQDRIDRQKCLQLLGVSLREGGEIPYAYCLMPDHIHLLLEETHEGELAKTVRGFLSGYTLYFNHRHQKTGNLFSHHRVILADKDAYLKTLVRYILLNPVRAGLAKSAENYPWTCCAAYAGTGTPGPVHPPVDKFLTLFGKSIRSGRKAFKDFMRAGAKEGYRKDFYPAGDGSVLGGEAFAARVKRMIESAEAETTPKRVIPIDLKALWKGLLNREGLDREPGGRRRSTLVEEAVFLATERLGTRQKEIGEFFGLGQSGISRALRRVEGKWKAAPEDRKSSLEWLEGYYAHLAPHEGQGELFRPTTPIPQAKLVMGGDERNERCPDEGKRSSRERMDL